MRSIQQVYFNIGLDHCSILLDCDLGPYIHHVTMLKVFPCLKLLTAQNMTQELHYYLMLLSVMSKIDRYELNSFHIWWPHHVIERLCWCSQVSSAGRQYAYRQFILIMSSILLMIMDFVGAKRTLLMTTIQWFLEYPINM